ncbi:hypothetical protein WAZ07_23285 [Bacillus sp. FJAT-51639]|uniref:Uncharacterized protein n=1 Tax=Bacillus bruguierae TaxID=3127667 RepID=A0ABU8FN28_9BACI
MAIKVIRATGMMGGVTRVALKVDNEVVMKLENNEAYTLPSDVKEAKIKANQLFFGSKEKQVKSGDIVEIKINGIAMLLYIVSLIAVVYGSMIDRSVILFAFIVSLVTLVYSIKNWFKLEVK